MDASAVELPTCVDPLLSIELVASEPDIVTPVSCRFDSRGRLLVVESHTHFPKEDYDGPKTDRIKIIDDPDGDGTLNRIRVFHEGTNKTMSLTIGQDDSVYVATRASILRLRDTNGDDVADEITTLINLETKADYPHNGLSGLLLEEPLGKPAMLTFGMGENFGERYVLKGTDGSLQTGGGEGGNIFKCLADGSKIERVATGFWNPFGICRDDAGRLLMVDNDADAMPPCRIVHVLDEADYGFQFRFGRAGTHPLQAWNGELPGTLPMLAGTGEAPCSIMCFRGQYWVTSWGDNRIERYTPSHHGATVRADRDIAVLGGAMFRPVDMAIASDGSMYVTDWVDRSYNVHRTGRIWRIRFGGPPTKNTALTLSPDEVFAQTGLVELSADAITQASDSNNDPFFKHYARLALKKKHTFKTNEPSSNSGVELRLTALLSQHWDSLAGTGEVLNDEQRHAIIRHSLSDDDTDIQLTAVRWAAESGAKNLLPEITAMLDRDTLSPQMLAATASAISFLKAGKVEPGGYDTITRQTLADIAMDEKRSSRIRLTALRLVPPEATQWNVNSLASMVRGNDERLARDAARHLAVAASTTDTHRAVVESLIEDSSLDADIITDLAINRRTEVDNRSPTPSHPPMDNLDEWLKVVGDGGDAKQGWRVFYSSAAGKCSSCHRRDGRGAGVGPDLSTLSASTMDRRRLLESILHPSREIGPMFTTWRVLTTDGRAIVGLKLNGGGVGQSARYLLADSTTIDVQMEEIEHQEASNLSIMPDGLVQVMTMDEIRNLLAYLSSQADD